MIYVHEREEKSNIIDCSDNVSKYNCFVACFDILILCF